MVTLYISTLGLGLVAGVVIGVFPYIYRIVNEGSALVC